MSELLPRIENLERDRDAAFHRIDEMRRLIENIHRSHSEIKTVLVGLHGQNGLKGEVQNLDREFSGFRAEVRQARDDDRAAAEKQRTTDAAERKATMRYTVGWILTTGGLIIAALRFFV